MRKRVILSGVAALVLIAATNTAQATFVAAPNFENKYRGKTAQEWHGLYVGEYLDKTEAYRMIGSLLKNPKKKKVLRSVNFLRSKVVEHRQATWRWQDIMLVPRTPSSNYEKFTKSRVFLNWLAKKWYDRRATAKKRAENPPHLQQWLCLHSHEGAWNDPNSPYYGGLQMDLSFQRAHGWDALQRWGTADNWHPLTQMWVAERAYVTRGFGPWPNTRLMCGI